MNSSELVKLFLRLGIASVFLYAAVAATLMPSNWIGYLPTFLRNLFSDMVLLSGFSLYEVIVGIWVLSGWKGNFAALLAAFTLLGIIAANITQLDILFRDFAIFFAALALFFAEKK